MSEVPVVLKKIAYRAPVIVRGIPATNVNTEIVTGIQLPNSSPVNFLHFLREGTVSGREVLNMPLEFAVRFDAFCRRHYVEGSPDFCCHRFLASVMGWDTANSDRLGVYVGTRDIDPENTEPLKPYCIKSQRSMAVHSVLGTERPGFSLGPVGPEYPLIIAKNTELLVAYGGVAMVEVKGAQVQQD